MGGPQCVFCPACWALRVSSPAKFRCGALQTDPCQEAVGSVDTLQQKNDALGGTTRTSTQPLSANGNSRRTPVPLNPGQTRSTSQGDQTHACCRSNSTNLWSSISSSSTVQTTRACQSKVQCRHPHPPIGWGTVSDRCTGNLNVANVVYHLLR